MNELQDLLSRLDHNMSSEKKNSFNVSNMLQNMIYFFNIDDIRDYLINHYRNLLPIGKKTVWDGTYYFNEQGILDEYYHPKEHEKHINTFISERVALQSKNHNYALFTCCILYEQNRVHYLSFIYDIKNKILISFDPGIHLYTKGQDILVPLVRNAFIKNKLINNKSKSFERIGLCKNKYHDKQWGIQYDGSDPRLTDLPADSFCQSWTIFFLIEFMKNNCSDSFFSEWCSIAPKYREMFIIMNYFLPHLQQDPVIYKKFLKFYPSANLPALMSHTISLFPQQ